MKRNIIVLLLMLGLVISPRFGLAEDSIEGDWWITINGQDTGAAKFTFSNLLGETLDVTGFGLTLDIGEVFFVAPNQTLTRASNGNISGQINIEDETGGPLGVFIINQGKANKSFDKLRLKGVLRAPVGVNIKLRGSRFPTEAPVLSGFTDESKVGGNKVKSRLYDLLVREAELLGFPAYEYLGTGPIEVDGVEIPDVLMAGQLIIDAKFKAYGTFFSDEFGVGVTRGKLRLPSDSTVPVAKFKAEADRKIKIKASLDEAVSPRISVDPESTVDYGSINIGSTVTLTFTVKNVGRGTLMGEVTVASPFEIVSGSPYSIPKDGEATVEVRFSPTVTGSFSEALIFTGGGGATRTVTGTASDVGAVLSVDPAGELDFGTVSLIVFSSVDLSFTATNIGTGTLVGKVTLGQAGVFRLVNNNQIVDSIDYALAANQSTTIMVRFTPVSVGVVTDKVTFTGGGGAMREVRGVGGI